MREVKVYEARSLYCQDTEQLASGFMGKFDVVLKADHDAALRRAKAEGAREMIKIVKANRADQRVADDLNNTVSFDSFNEVLDAITREADARAAQIEEGE